MSTLDEEKAGLEAINKLKSSDPPLFLSPNSDLSSSTRIASQYLFTCLKPYSPKSPFEQLHTNGFDAEQIWQQIDLQSQPLIATLKREIKRFEKNPDQILKPFGVSESNGVLEGGTKENGDVGFDGDSDEFEGLSDEDEDDDDDDDDEEEDDGNDDEDDGDDGESEEEEVEDDGDGVPEVEDEFLKIKDLEKYLVREEKKEYGSEDKNKKKKKKGGPNVDDEDKDEGEEDEEEEDDDELMMYGGDAGDEDESEDNIRYEDFFVPNKKAPKRKRKQVDQSDEEMEDEKDDDSEMEDEDEDEDDTKMEDDGKQDKGNLSTFERERESIQAKIKQMEAENLAPKDWTMQGEVSASKRPKDSALEVDLHFEHNVRPPPVITEEVTASLEEIIKKRILEGHFDDVQRAPKLASAAPKEAKELDDNKSKKGLGEIYEEEYAQQTGLASAPLSFNDELKKEASGLFKRLCLKLDALSHFHFAPKPVVEDMSIQTNVPALAMEEIAPVAVSDAAMLAPEEVFSGKKVVKEENEFTKEDRKKRRAKKKRKLKAINAKKAASRAPEKPSQIQTEGKE